ncbi:MAG TPA: DedA family protein, partial [Verrucomicrobiota bacterium]|nr:DedA family protein [Verrucomicrobiota bacterium]
PLILLLAGFAEQRGMPFPGSLFVVAAGALAASGKLDLLAVIGWTAGGCILADAMLYVLGHYGKSRVFRMFPHLQAVQVKLERATVARTILHGMRMLTVAKFVPLGQVVAMHAGAMEVNRLRFLLVDAFTSVIYAAVYAALGFAFHNQLEQVVVFLQELGTVSLVLIGGAVGAYGVYRLVKHHRTQRRPCLIPGRASLKGEYVIHHLHHSTVSGRIFSIRLRIKGLIDMIATHRNNGPQGVPFSPGVRPKQAETSSVPLPLFRTISEAHASKRATAFGRRFLSFQRIGRSRAGVRFHTTMKSLPGGW